MHYPEVLKYLSPDYFHGNLFYRTFALAALGRPILLILVGADFREFIELLREMLLLGFAFSVLSGSSVVCGVM